MSLTSRPLHVNSSNGVCSDNNAITYSPVTKYTYDFGPADIGGPAGDLFTKFDATGTKVTQVVFDATTCPISGNNTLYRSVNHQLVASPDGTRVLAITAFHDGTHNYTTPGLSSFDPNTLIENGFCAFTNTSTDMPFVVFTLQGIGYAAVHLSDQKIKIVRLSDFTDRGELSTGLNHSNNGFFCLVAGSSSGALQQLYAAYSTTVFADGTGGSIKFANFEYNATSNTIDYASDDDVYTMETIDSGWHYGGGSASVGIFNPVWDNYNNKIIAHVYLATGTPDSGHPVANIVKFNIGSSHTILWRIAVPSNQSAGMQSSQSQVNGNLTYLIGQDDGSGYSFPFPVSSSSSGSLLRINTTDGTYTVESYSFLASNGTGGSQRPFVYFQDDNVFLFYVTNPGGGLVINNGWGALVQATAVVRHFSFANFTDTTFHDWSTPNSDGTIAAQGADFKSHITTYSNFNDDPDDRAQSPYCHIFLDNTGSQTKSMFLRMAFDWAIHPDSKKWSTKVQTYRISPFKSLSVSRNKIFGRGRVFNLELTSEEGKDFHITGWGIWATKLDRP